MNVTELARQLNTTREELLAKLPEFGFDIGARAIKVDNSIAERIKEAWRQDLKTEKLKAKIQASEKVSEAKKKLNEDSSVIKIPERITVNDFSEKLGTPVAHLIGYLMKNGIMASLNQEIDFETANIVAEDYGFRIKKETSEDSSKINLSDGADLKNLKKEILEDVEAVPRPPVVVVMGHVDHGKTTLLDAIRSTNVVEGEFGGITQHIGAYQIEEKGRMITFLDTPGHEAFKAMRERGGQVADVAILVVAADDGLKPQTIESINVIQKAKLPFVVAINKIDKPGADIDNVKKELAEVNLNPEDWGGKTITVPISAKQKQNISELLDMVLLVADLEKFSANPNGPVSGVVIESHIDPGEGAVSTVLVTSGTLVKGTEAVIGDTYCRIKALKNWLGENIVEALPSTPVKILGLKSTPKVGDIMRSKKIDRETRKKKAKDYKFIDIEQKKVLQQEGEEDNTEKESFKIIVKADMLGSLEAFLAALKKKEKEEVSINVIKQGLGNITESDLSLAEDSGALVYGFNVHMSSEAQKTSYQSKVLVKISKIIYELLDDIEENVKKLIKEEIVEVQQGELHITNIFRSSKSGSIIGGRVKRSAISSNAKFRLIREGEPVDEGKIDEIQQNKQKVSMVPENSECGMQISGVKILHEGDILDCYLEEKHKAV